MLAPRPAGAHEVRPGYLDLTETSANLFDMTWKVPALGAFHLAIEPRFPDFCHIVGAPIAIETGVRSSNMASCDANEGWEAAS